MMLNQHQQQPRRGPTDSVLQMIRMLDMYAATLQDDEAALLLLRMAARALAQLQSHSDRVTAEAVNWQDKYERMGQLYHELAEKNLNLDEENGRLLFKCHRLEEADADDDLRVLFNDDDVPKKKIDDDVEDEREQPEWCAPLPLPDQDALPKAAPRHETTTTTRTNASSFRFNDDVYGQLDQFEHSLDMELEEIQELGLLGSSSVVARASPGEKEKNACADDNSERGASSDSECVQASSPCYEVIVSETSLPMSPLQDKTIDASKDTASTSNMNPLQLFHRLFQTHTDVPMPALTTSDSLFSLSSDYSISAESRSSDVFIPTPNKTSTKNSPRPNVEWAIIK